MVDTNDNDDNIWFYFKECFNINCVTKKLDGRFYPQIFLEEALVE